MPHHSLLTAAANLPPIGPLELIAGLLLLGSVTALVMALRNSTLSSGAAAGPVRASPTSREEADSASQELRALIAEARTIADQLADRFDRRAEELHRLLAEAERAASRLDALASPAPRAAAIPDREPKPAPAAPERSLFSNDPRPLTVAEAQELISSDLRPGRTRMPRDPDLSGVEEPDLITREIYRLADSGLPPVDIASRLGQHTGKVELILALRRG